MQISRKHEFVIACGTPHCRSRRLQKKAPGGKYKVHAKLNNAVAATAIGAFLRRISREGRNPDCWEAEHAIRAMAFLACDQYGRATDHIGRASIPPSKRDPKAVASLDQTAGHLIVASLAALQIILDEICDAGEAFARPIGEALGNEAAEPELQEQEAPCRLPASSRAGRMRPH
jgi:hypothetical protein